MFSRLTRGCSTKNMSNIYRQTLPDKITIDERKKESPTCPNNCGPIAAHLTELIDITKEDSVVHPLLIRFTVDTSPWIILF